MAPAMHSRKASAPALGHDSIDDYEYHQNGMSVSVGSQSSNSGFSSKTSKTQKRPSQPMTAKASFNPINSARTSLLNVLSSAKGKKKGDRANADGGNADEDGRGGQFQETAAGEVIRNYLMQSSSSASSFISASSTSSGSTQTSRGSGTSAVSKDGTLLTPTSSIMASPLSSPELHRNQSGGKGLSSSQLASSLGNSMSQPQSTFNRFDEIDIAPYELSDNMISILEKPLGQSAQRAYALSVSGRQTQSYGSHDGFKLNVTGPSTHWITASQTGTLVGGKSGAKHEEYGFCMNQNWRYTSKVSLDCTDGRSFLTRCRSMIQKPERRKNFSHLTTSFLPLISGMLHQDLAEM